MKKILSLLLIITFASHFGTNAVFAQKDRKSREVIVVEYLMAGDKSSEKLEIPVNGDNGVGSVSECLDWTGREDECTKAYSSFELSGKTLQISKNTARVNFKAEIFADSKECKTRKIFTVYRNRQTRLQLKCGVSLIAYYGFASAETN